MEETDRDRDALVEALLTGGAVLDRSGWRRVAVTGADARGWLQDLVTAGVADLEPGASRRSLLLSPTGRIRADFTVVARDDGLLLVQDPTQPEAVDAVLARYVLSSDVDLRAVDVAVVAVPSPAPDGGQASGGPILDPAYVVAPAPASTPVADDDAAEAWRVVRGDPRFGVDLDRDSLPAEAGLALQHTIDTTKGCFLGQESVAKVRNLGHPPRVLRHLGTDGEVRAGAVVRSGKDEVGVVTSATRWRGRTILLARVRWAARATALTADGAPLDPVDAG